MHLFDVTLTPLQRRNRAAFVPSSTTPVLRSGEKVVLRDQDGEYYAGTVVGPADDSEQRVHVHIGVRMPEEYALMRLERDRQLDQVLTSLLDGDPDESEAVLDDDVEVCGPAMVDDVQELLDLLGNARESLARRAARRLVQEDLARDVRESGAVVVPLMPPQRLA